MRQNAIEYKVAISEAECIQTLDRLLCEIKEAHNNSELLGGESVELIEYAQHRKIVVLHKQDSAAESISRRIDRAGDMVEIDGVIRAMYDLSRAELLSDADFATLHAKACRRIKSSAFHTTELLGDV